MDENAEPLPATLTNTVKPEDALAAIETSIKWAEENSVLSSTLTAMRKVRDKILLEMRKGAIRSPSAYMQSQICDSKRPPNEPPSSTSVKSEYFPESDHPPKEQATRKRKAEAALVNVKAEPDESTEVVQNPPRNHCTFDFYNIPCVDLSKKLLGKVLVRHLADGTVARGRIVETEAYLGGEDKASMSYQGKKTGRNEPMFMRPGTAFVYVTYGMYHCFNISSKGDGAAVLLRALEPLEGLEHMLSRRLAHRKPSKNLARDFKTHELCNGPAKLAISFGIDKATCNKLDLNDGGALYIEPGDDVPDHRIVISTRVGISSEGRLAWAGMPLRFYELGNASVSVRDLKAEAKMNVSNETK